MSPDIDEFLVAGGGLPSITHPAKFMLDQHSAALASDVLNAEEFVRRAPRRLGSGSLVVLCLMTGTSAETVRAAEFARAAGTLTFGMTTDSTSPLVRACDGVIVHLAIFRPPSTVPTRPSLPRPSPSRRGSRENG